jgi:hypothetical protein
MKHSLMVTLQIIKQRQQLATLPRAEYAAFDTFKKDAPPPSKCHTRTRAEILEDIQSWGKGHGDNCIFWLSGMAGTGKSTIARTVAENFHRQKRLGASFFFSRGQGLRAEATAFFTTLAIQLTEALPDITTHICHAVAQHSKISEQSLSDQWDVLILEPLSMLAASLLTPLVLVFVIDALDECKGVMYVPEILRLLARANALKIIQLRIFITSRRESYIHSSFEQIPQILHRDLMLDSALDGRTERDISIFLRDKLAEVARTHSLKDWPSEKDTQELIKRAGRLFIYAATTYLFLQNSNFPDERLPEMLDVKYTGHSSTEELDNMYMLVLRQPITDCCDEERNDLVRRFKRIVGSIIILSEALSSIALEMLLHVRPREISTILNPLRSVLNVPDDDKSPVQYFHLSFHDFLLDKKRCTDPQLWVDQKETNKDLFERCLDLMSEHLRRDICALRRPGVLASEVDKSKVESCLPPAVQYACCYFVTHLTGARISLRDGDRLHMFLRKHFLHWLEALSLIGKTSEGILAITSLESVIIVSKPAADPADSD